jgi:type 1 glutamine amidotransferase
VASGKPLVGLRTASHAFKLKRGPDGSYPIPEGSAEWGAFDAEVLGGSYSGHEANEIGADIKNVKPDHPILQGVAPAAWHSLGSLYNTGKIVDGAVILQEGSIPGVSEAVTWIREPAPGRGKVFYTSLGHPEDFKESAFRHLLVNALRWSIGKS